MPKSVLVHFLPSLTTPEALAGGTVIVIDVLRASTTIVEALAAGAREVIPCLEVDEARRIAAELPPEEVRLGGERGGLPIEGFDLGNSPAEYTSAAVGGRTVVFTTTNGTRTMMQCREAARVLVGAFVNRAAIFRAITGSDAIHLLCAGTRGEITREDVLFAGSLIFELVERLPAGYELNDQAVIALDAWQAAVASLGLENKPAHAGLAELLKETRGGRNLKAIGLDADIEHASAVDRHNIVPELDIVFWRIRAA
jgi:2-phosphosulfolactate phosphatase